MMRPPRQSKVRDKLAGVIREMIGEVGDRDATLIAVDVLLGELATGNMEHDRRPLTLQQAYIGVATALQWASNKREESALTQERFQKMAADIAERLRQQARASASATGPGWWTVLGLSRDAGPIQVKAAYREKAKTAHPDHGGSEAAMTALNAARDEGLKARRQ